MSIQIAGRGNNLGGPVAKISGSVTPPAVTYILDTLALATPLACSTRKLRAAYAGSCMRVRRSNDNLELDIGFTAAGDLDTAALLAHTGANSGFVTTWYDQSGNARHFTQATVGDQPRIVNAGVIERMSLGTARPMVKTDGATWNMPTSAFAVPQPFTRSTVVQSLRVADQDRIYGDTANTNVLFFSPAGILNAYAGAVLVGKTGIIAGDTATIIEDYEGATSAVRYNGAAIVGDSGTGGITAGFTLAKNPAGGTLFLGLFGDIIVFASTLSGTNLNTLEANQKSWFGTP